MIDTVTLNPAIDKVLEAPHFEVGAHARVDVRTLLPAGKGVNVARGIGRMQGTARATGLVGRNEQALYAESLAADGVTADFCAVQGRTRTNTTILDPRRHTTTHLREPGFAVGPDDLRALRARLAQEVRAHESTTLVFASSMPPGLEPGDFADLLDYCAGLGARIMVDTNGPPLRAAVESGAVDVVAPNEEELAQCLGRTVEPERAPEAARDLLDRVETVLLTLGERGACVVRADGTVGRRCPLREGELRNTVGCGDALLAGWLRGQERERDPADVLCWAVAAGAASAMSETTVGYTLAQVRDLLPRCEPIG